MPSSWLSLPSWSSWRSSSCNPPSPTPSTTSPTACRLTSRRLKHQQDGGATAAPPSCCLYRFAVGTLACLLIARDVRQGGKLSSTKKRHPPGGLLRPVSLPGAVVIGRRRHRPSRPP